MSRRDRAHGLGVLNLATGVLRTAVVVNSPSMHSLHPPFMHENFTIVASLKRLQIAGGRRRVGNSK